MWGERTRAGAICESSNVIKLCLCVHTNAYIAYFSTHAQSLHVLAHNGVLKIDTFVPSNCSVWPKASLVSALLCAVQPISTSHGSRQSTRGLSWRTTTPCCSIPLFLPWIKMPLYTTLVTPTATNCIKEWRRRERWGNAHCYWTCSMNSLEHPQKWLLWKIGQIKCSSSRIENDLSRPCSGFNSKHAADFDRETFGAVRLGPVPAISPNRQSKY